MEHSCAMNAQYMQHSFCNATFVELGGGGGGGWNSGSNTYVCARQVVVLLAGLR